MKRKEASAKKKIGPKTSKTRRKSAKRKGVAAQRASTRRSRPKTKTRPGSPTKRTTRKLAPKKILKIPPILLEGDQPTPIPISGPGQKYVLAPSSAAAAPETVEKSLPEAYGTGKLFLAARDPHWLYAHWDLTREQQRSYNEFSKDRHLVLRIYRSVVAGKPVSEIHVHPESRYWFIYVERAATKYAAELGYYGTGLRWKRVCLSGITLTPSDTVSQETGALFATIPIDLPFSKLIALVKQTIHENVPLAGALEQMRAAGNPRLPPQSAPPAQWTVEQEKALAAVLNLDEVRRVWIGSLEITELIRRQLAREISSVTLSPFGGVAGVTAEAGLGAGASISSPLGGPPSESGFWFNINAELIIYGATEPDASVKIGGRPIKLRPDGSFSYHFALPDGQYELPIVAVSSDQTDARAAELKCSRATEYHGDVGVHPQEAQLKLATVENVS